jgi:SH3-like domain-containing protein
LINSLGVERKKEFNQAIRKTPADNSEVIKYSEKDCFSVKQCKGDWIEITTSEDCGDIEIKKKVTSGWIKWREGNMLLIEYFLLM